ncbi:MAG: hypothetical protein MUO76_03035, partial [Anaerolineaceae bacterium]|nr:hypothetical protein [Anaerolineaceae bacterium]
INFDDLQDTVTDHDSPSLWNYEWDGDLQLSTGIILFLQLFIFSLGVGISWYRNRSAGLIPLIFFLAYNLSTAVANTSGGRYIVPVNWVVLVYFGIGLSGCVAGICYLLGIKNLGIGKEAIIETQPVKTSAYVGIILFFLFLGSTPIISENLFDRRYPELTNIETLDNLSAYRAVNELDFELIRDFIQSKHAVIYEGRALYPRYLDYDDDRAGELFSKISKKEAQLTFQLIGPTTALVTLPMNQTPSYFPHESNVFVIGCLYKKGGIDAFVDSELQAFKVFIVEEDSSIITYNREPMTEFICAPANP